MKKRILVVVVVLAALELALFGVIAHYQESHTPEVLRLRSQIEELKEQRARNQEMLRELAEISRLERTSGLANADATIAREAVKGLTAQGTSVLPMMRSLMDSSSNPEVRRRAKEVIGRVTGNWGAKSDLVWKRSMAEAISAASGKPILLLQLFGNLDEEFC